MDKELIFQILGISETDGEDEIRSAYRALLKSTNPEDDPEGFKRLRQAYEEALQLLSAQKEQAEEDDVFKTEIDLWIDRVEELYLDLFVRYKTELWKELLADPVCEGLDTSLEAREKLLVFLMDHIRLPHEVWKLIDETFEITVDLETLQEKFPANFLNYVQYYATNDTFIPYELFEYRDWNGEEINADGYIDKYLDIKKQIDNEEPEGCLQALDDLKAYHIYHPFEDVERLRVYVMEERCEEGVALAQELLEKYPNCNYIMLFAGRIKWGIGEKEQAYALWQSVLSTEPDYYLAKYLCVTYLMEKENYYEARDLLLDLLSVNDRDEELRNYIYKVNEALILEFQETLASGKEDERLSEEEMKLKLGWCLFQNEKLEEAEELVHTLCSEGEYEYGYNNLYGQLLYRMKRYEEAVPCLKRWAELCTGLTDDGTEETRKRISRQGVAHAMLSYCYYQLGRNEEGQAEAQLAVDTASDRGEFLENLQYQAGQLLSIEEYEKAVDVCDRLISEDGGYYPAYLIRQEACYEMRRAQQVIDDYYNAIEIYPGFYKPYLFAAKVFFFYGQYEDAIGVINRARENQVEFSAQMKLFEAKILRNTARGSEDRKRPKEILAQLAGELSDENCDIEDKSEVVYERGLLCWDDNEFDEALAFMQQAIDQNPDRQQYRLIRGHIYLEMKKYQDALKEYEAVKEDYAEAPELYYNKGCAYEGLNDNNAAIENYKRTLELDEQYRNTNDKLYSLYRQIYRRENRKEDFEKALYYINKEIEIRENDATLFHRAVLYDDAMETELSIKDYEKALEYYPDDAITYSNMGFCYRAVRRFEEAVNCFQKAKELMENKDDNTRPYYQLSKCYMSLKNYEKAIEICKEGLEIFREDSDFWEQLGLIYERQENYKEALQAYEKMKGHNNDYYNNTAEVWVKLGKLSKGVRVLEKGIKEVKEDERAKLYGQLGDIYYGQLEYKKAEENYLKAISLEKDHIELFDYERYLAQNYYLMGKYEKAKEHAIKAIEHFHKAGRDEESYMSYTAYAPARIGLFGWIYLCMGDREKAEECFRKMEEIQPCRFCEYKKCFESSLWLGRMYESMGNYEKAIELMEETLRRKSDLVQAKNVLKKLRRKL